MKNEILSFWSDFVGSEQEIYDFKLFLLYFLKYKHVMSCHILNGKRNVCKHGCKMERAKCAAAEICSLECLLVYNYIHMVASTRLKLKSGTSFLRLVFQGGNSFWQIEFKNIRAKFPKQSRTLILPSFRCYIMEYQLGFHDVIWQRSIPCTSHIKISTVGYSLCISSHR